MYWAALGKYDDPPYMGGAVYNVIHEHPTTAISQHSTPIQSLYSIDIHALKHPEEPMLEEFFKKSTMIWVG